MIASRVRRKFTWALLAFSGLVLAACSPAAQGPTSWPGVAAGTDRVFVANGPAVYAVDLDGDEIWRYPAEPVRDLSFFAAPAVADDGQVYAASYNGNVVAFDAESGDVTWQFSGPDGEDAPANRRIIGSPTIAGDVLLVPTDAGLLYFLDRQDGDILRTFDAGGQLWSAPRVEGDTIYLASLSHEIIAVDLATAEARWTVDLGFAVADTPTLEDETILTGLLGNALVALRALDGDEVWRVDSQGWLWGSPAVVDGRAIFGDVAGNVYALDLADGALAWQATPGEAITSSPVVTDGHVILGSESGNLISYNLETQAVEWDESAAGPILSDPVLAGDFVIVAVTSDEALLQAFDAATGDPAWVFQPASGR